MDGHHCLAEGASFSSDAAVKRVPDAAQGLRTIHTPLPPSPRQCVLSDRKGSLDTEASRKGKNKFTCQMSKTFRLEKNWLIRYKPQQEFKGEISKIPRFPSSHWSVPGKKNNSVDAGHHGGMAAQLKPGRTLFLSWNPGLQETSRFIILRQNQSGDCYFWVNCGYKVCPSTGYVTCMALLEAGLLHCQPFAPNF